MMIRRIRVCELLSTSINSGTTSQSISAGKLVQAPADAVILAMLFPQHKMIERLGEQIQKQKVC